jgi:glycerol-1-phosphate dehydrogenase [NAD(P)+]
MTQIDPIYVGSEAVAQLLAYCEARQLRKFTLIADTNTYRVLGARVEAALKANSYTVTSVVLEGDEIIANERYLIQALVGSPVGESTFVAVGTGTLTDITRFVSHRSGRQFISMPTAPSVDGFTSIGAPVVLNGIKLTIVSQPPIALFADLQTLYEAPQPLIAAGFGDMLGKITSLADWRLGALLWDEPFDDAIAQRSEAAIALCLDNTRDIGQRSPEAIHHLMDALIESGLCMLDFGESRPASGAEHHASHYWEMKLLQEQRPSILHGAKVGYALIGVAQQYEKIRAISHEDVLDRLEEAVLPDREAEIAHIHEGYGPIGDGVIKGHGAFLDLTPAEFDSLKRRIAENWDGIQRIAAGVPPAQEIVNYLRSRFTVMKLSRVLGLPPITVNHRG